MAKKSEFLSAFGTVFQIWKAITDAVLERGGSDDDVRRILTSKKLAGAIADLIVETKKLVLKRLKLVAEGIVVKTGSFVKSSFFKKDGLVKLYFGSNFINWVLTAIPETVPAFEGKLTQTQLMKYMSDSEILSDLGNPAPFTPSEFAATVSCLLSKQPNGKAGTLLTNGYANIFYVKLADERVVTVHVLWYSVACDWYLNTFDLGDVRWDDGPCVFSRS